MAQTVRVYPSMPFRINLMVISWMVLSVLLIMHSLDRRAGGE